MRSSPTWFFASLVLLTGCDAGRGAPRLVSAPPLPETGIVVDLGLPAAIDAAMQPPIEAPSVPPLVITLARGAPLFEVALADGTSSSATIASVAPSRCIGKAVVLDIAARVSKDLRAALDVADIEAFENRHGRIRADEFVVLRTGYDAHAPLLRDPANAYAAPTQAPGFSLAAMRYLVSERGVRRIATDAPYLTTAPPNDRAVEKLLFERGGFAVTRLVALDRLPPRGATIVALPLAVPESPRAPARVFAIVPR